MHQEDSKASLVRCINAKGYEDGVNRLLSISVGLGRVARSMVSANQR